MQRLFVCCRIRQNSTTNVFRERMKNRREDILFERLSPVSPPYISRLMCQMKENDLSEITYHYHRTRNVFFEVTSACSLSALEHREATVPLCQGT